MAHQRADLRSPSIEEDLSDLGLLHEEQLLDGAASFRASQPCFEFKHNSRCIRAAVSLRGIEFTVIEWILTTWRPGLRRSQTSQQHGCEPVIRYWHLLEAESLADLEKSILFGVAKRRMSGHVSGRLIFQIFFRHFVRDF